MNQVKEYLYISIAMFIVSIAVYFFLGPSEVIVGSVSGLAFVLERIIHVRMSIITLVINIVLLLIGFILLGKEFGARTVYASILMSLYLMLFEEVVPLSGSITHNNVYDLVLYILVVGLGQAILFHINASSGGLDIVAKILSKYTPLDIGTAVTITGMGVACSSILVYDVGTLVVSLLGTYANGVVVDSFIDGFNKKKRICIVSDEYEDIKNYIMHDIHRGVSLYKVIGGYDGKERLELQTAMTKYEYKKLLHYLNNRSISAFVTVSTINEVIGTWNKKGG